MRKITARKVLRGEKPTRVRNLSGRLAAYSATAGAAVLCTPAAHPAITDITDSGLGANLLFNGTPVSLSNPPTLDFAGHSFADFGYLTIGPIHNFYLRGFGTTANQGFASIGTSHDRGIAVVAAGGYSAAKLPFGALIGGAGRVFSQYACNLAKMNGSSTAGQFLSPDGTGYIGFKQGVYYGWLKVAVSFNGDGVPVSLSLVPKADTDIYGAFGLLSDGVRAGETTAVPEPSAVGLGLGLFALGAVGVREMRRRRAAAAA